MPYKQLINENCDNDIPFHLKRDKIIAQLKEHFNFETSKLVPLVAEEEGLLSKCSRFESPEHAKKLGIYPYFHVIEEADNAHVVIDGKKAITVSTNNYLGLAQDPRVIDAAIKALKQFGSGCTGSRFLNGTLTLHKNLENDLSAYLGREDTVVMSTGFQANQGTISCLTGRKDLIFSDRENHASIYEGCAISPSKTLRYRHNDMEHLKFLLERHSDVPGKLIVTDSVFSMSGDIANLPAIVKLARDNGATILLDEAHGLGVIGSQGRGVASYYDVEDEIDIYMGTFSKSLGSIGGFVSGKSDVIRFIRHKATSFIFTAALPPASVASVNAALHIMIDEPQLLERLKKNTAYVKKGFFDMGFQVNNNQIPIVPILVGDEGLTLLFNRLLFENGIFASVAISPVVPVLQALIRTSYTAAHSQEDLDVILATFEKLGIQLGVISPARL